MSGITVTGGRLNAHGALLVARKGSVMNRQEILERYCAAFVALTPQTLNDLGALVSDDVRFRDPFNDVRGRAVFLKVFEDMFEQTQDPRFHVIDKALEKAA